MWRSNPINWTNLNWVKNALVMIVSNQTEALSLGEIDLTQELLTTIAADYPEYKEQAYALMQRLPTAPTKLWLPGNSRYAPLESHIRHAKQAEHQTWWDLYYFLSRFEERPAGQIVMAPRPKNRDLAYLEDQVKSGNMLAVPDYIEAHLDKMGLPPKLYIQHVTYWCDTHKKVIIPANPYPNFSTYGACPQTIWTEGNPWGKEVPLNRPCRISARLNGLEDWVSSLTFKNNLFAFKKEKFPQPTSVKIFLAAFFQAHQNNPAYLMFKKDVENYFRNTLAVAVEVIAELNIAPRPPQYPTQAITWQELVKLTNLRVDLIKEIPNSWYPADPLFDRDMGYLFENHHPLTILSFSHVKSQKLNSGRTYYETWLPRHGIMMDNDHYYNAWANTYSKQRATVRFGTFG